MCPTFTAPGFGKLHFVQQETTATEQNQTNFARQWKKKIHAPKLVSIIVPRIFRMTCASRGDLRDSSSRAHWAKNSKFVQKPQIVAIGKKFDIFKNFDQYACLLKCQKLKFLIFLKKDAQCVS